MIIKIFWNNNDSKELFKKVNLAIQELWLEDFMNLETTVDENLKKELSINFEPALIIEEESIDFKDMIFEWIVPDIEELKSMFISIIWWWESSCDSWCSSCNSWC